MIEYSESARKVFVFDEVYPFRAAQEQAEKKKLGAFGLFAKLNPLNRPKESGVLLSKQELRYEPFWEIAARRSVDYTCELTYPVAVHNPHANSVLLNERRYEVTRQSGKAKIELAVAEQCHRKIDYEVLQDGLGRPIKQAMLNQYIRKYKFSEVEALERSEAVAPSLSMTAMHQQALAGLSSEVINAYEIQADHVVFDKAHLYFRPVFAFEYIWSSADRLGVIEVDGLTGETLENGQWFKDKLSRVMTREMLFEVGTEVANGFLPGAGLAVKAIDKLTAVE